MRSVPAWLQSATRECPHCGRPTFVSRMTTVTDEVAALLGVQPDAEVAEDCRDRAEQELDAADAELALDDDAAFQTVCDARRDGWIAAMEADTAAQWAQWAAVVRCGDVLDRAVSL